MTSTTLSATPTLGTTTTLGNGITTVAIDPFGNIYISDFNQVDVLFFDIKTGYARKLIASGTLCAAKQDSVGDGCPVNNSNFACGASGMGIGISPQGDLYLADNTNLLIRKITATNLVPVTVGSTLTQTEILHGASGTTAIAAALAGTSPGITSGSVTCGAANADGTMDCTVPVTFTPSTPGQRSGVLAVSATGVTGSGNFAVAGTATGSALAVDSAAPTVVSTGSVSAPVSLAIDGAGNLFTMNTGTSNVVEISSGTTSSIAATLPTSPFQIAVDNMGNIYATGTGSSTITKLTPNGGGLYTQSAISYTPPTTPAAPYGARTTTSSTPASSSQDDLRPSGELLGDQRQCLGDRQHLDCDRNWTCDGAGVAKHVSQWRLCSGNSSVQELCSPMRTQARHPLPPPVALIAMVKSLATPYGIAIDAVGNAWVTNESGTTVTELSTTGNSLATPTAAGLAGAQGVAVDRSGNVWVANTAGNSVVKFTLTSGAVTATNSYTAGGITAPSAIAMDSGGNAFVANFNGNSVTGLTSAGVALGGSPFTGSSNNITVPSGIAVSPAGTVYVTSGNGSIVNLSNAGAFLATLNDGTLQGPVGVAVDASGRILATGFTTGASIGGALSQLTLGGTAVAGSPATSGITVASDGTTIWVANNTASGALAQFSHASSLPVSPIAGFGSLSSPAGVAVDASGSVWTANSGSNTVSKFIGLAVPVTTPLAANVGP